MSGNKLHVKDQAAYSIVPAAPAHLLVTIGDRTMVVEVRPHQTVNVMFGDLPVKIQRGA